MSDEAPAGRQIREAGIQAASSAQPPSTPPWSPSASTNDGVPPLRGIPVSPPPHGTPPWGPSASRLPTAHCDGEGETRNLLAPLPLGERFGEGAGPSPTRTSV